MLQLFYCGFDSHLQFTSPTLDPSESLVKKHIFPLNSLSLDSKYGGKIKKAFIGWCTLFVITESGHLLYISKGSSFTTVVQECNLAKSWDLKLLECGTKDVFLVLSDRVLKRWQAEDYLSEPKVVEALTENNLKAVEISVGSCFVCVLLENGTVKGMDEEGCPVNFEPENSDPFVSVSCGHEHILLLTEKGRVFVFGRGSKGQLGLDSLNDCFEAHKEVDALAGMKIMQVAAGGFHSLALSEFGDIYAWGWNESGQLGINSTDSVKVLPTLIELDDVNFVNISCGSRHSMASSENGFLFAWGWNKYGQLGVDPENVKLQRYPLKVEFGYKVTSIFCKYWSSVIEAT